MKTPRSISYVLISGLLAFAALQGCGDEDGNPTPPIVIPSGGGQDNEGGTGNTGNHAGTQSNPGGAPSEGGTTSQPTAGQPSEGGGAGAPQPTCNLPPLGEDGCFNCPESGEVEQWLNRCVDSECEPFDNSQTRLPLIKADGTLPALPN